jgi:hypothetical protein
MHTTKQLGSNKKANALYLFLSIICLALTLYSALWFWSSVLTVRPAQLLSQWQHKPAEFDQALAIKLIPRLKQSLSFNAGDASTYLLLAELYQMLAAHEAVSSGYLEQTQSYLHLAEDNYKKAIQHQPTWDYAWAKLATFYDQQLTENAVKGNQLEKQSHAKPFSNTQNRTFLLMSWSLKRSIKLGPYESNTQRLILPLIFKHFELLPNKSSINKVLKHTFTFKKNASLALALAKKFKRLDVVAPFLVSENQKKIYNRYQTQMTAP